MTTTQAIKAILPAWINNGLTIGGWIALLTLGLQLSSSDIFDEMNNPANPILYRVFCFGFGSCVYTGTNLIVVSVFSCFLGGQAARFLDQPVVCNTYGELWWRSVVFGIISYAALASVSDQTAFLAADQKQYFRLWVFVVLAGVGLGYNPANLPNLLPKKGPDNEAND